ncbi:hypothetical protein [Sphingopyxis indica]|uniref:Uncharacterized protein n=1 Tax=Sphingopyxis indica TaxID=436663 RepID=A0A239KHD3_9SPHN|nr:hypothetical protein [Sphingopyxis indica]SNT17767.1 hypothetical protein SAMN06295955_11468 [Sphingopyxis indica]
MTRHWFRGFFWAAMAAASAIPAGAAALEPAEVAVPAGQAWTHPHSGIAVPATLGGITRTKVIAFAPDNLDVGVAFETKGAAESLTLYVFRDTSGDIPVWFAQAQGSVEARALFGNPSPAIAPQAFVPPGQATASALRTVYAPHGDSGYRSTGIVMLAVGDWYVKLRASSKSRGPAELAAWMNDILAEIRWPDRIEGHAPATPVTDCAVPLAFAADAADAPSDAGSRAAAAFGVMFQQQGTSSNPFKAQPIARWCRDEVVGDNMRVYRPDDGSDRYLIALGDNGNAVLVGKTGAWSAVTPAGNASAPYQILLVSAAETMLYAPQTGLPSIDRVAEVLNAGHPVARLSGWGKDAEIDILTDPK